MTSERYMASAWGGASVVNFFGIDCRSCASRRFLPDFAPRVAAS